MKNIDVVRVIDEAPISRFQWWTIVLCGLVAILDGLDTQAIAFVAPVIAREWSMELSAFGPIFGAGLLGLTIGALLLGPLADRIGRRRVIVLSTVWFGLCSLFTVFADAPGELLALRLLTGIGLGGAMPNIIALTSEYSPKRVRATLVTLMFCGFPLGAVLGGMASAPMIAAYGWQSVFVMGGVLPLAVAVVLFFALPESIRYMVARKDNEKAIGMVLRRIDPAGGADGPDCRYALTEPALGGLPIKHLFQGGRTGGTLVLWTIFFCNLLVMYFLISWLPSVLRQAGLPVERAVIATVLLNAGGILGGLVLGRMVDRRGPFRVLFPSYLMATLLIALIGQATGNVPLIMATVFVAGFFVIGTQFCMNAMAASYYPTSIRSTGVGWALGIGRIGSIIGPVIGGVLLAFDWSTSALFIAAAVPAFIAAVCVPVIGRRRKGASAELEEDLSRAEPMARAADIR